MVEKGPAGPGFGTKLAGFSKRATKTVWQAILFGFGSTLGRDCAQGLVNEGKQVF